MNNGDLARLKYYRGQMLTARDFADQQEYHRRKQRLFLRRFPPGIIDGLNVICEAKGADASDFDGFRIGEGLAVDPRGNELVVPEAGIKEPVSNFKAATPYLSLAYVETDEVVGSDACGGAQKNNRTVEKVVVRWDPAPNMDDPDSRLPPHVTVAKIQLIDETSAGTICAEFRNPMNPQLDIGEPPVRVNARVVDTDQITDGAVTAPKIKNRAVTTDKLDDGAVVEQKLAKDSVTKDKIGPAAVVKGKIGPAAVAAGNLEAGAVLPNDIANDAVLPGNIADGAVLPNNLADDSVLPGNIANGAVLPQNLADGAVLPNNIANGAVLPGNIANAAVLPNNIANDAVLPGNIADGAVLPNNLANGSVLPNNIANGAVLPNNLANGAVLPNNIANGAVLPNNIANDAVLPGNIANGAVLANNIANAAVLPNNLANGAVLPNNIANNAVLPGNIAPNAVTENTILAGAVTSGKLNLTTTDPAERLLSPGQSTDVPIPPNAIANVILNEPGLLSWTYVVKREPNSNNQIYNVRVTNPDPNPAGEVLSFHVRVIAFN